jgi:hypothetical protein
VRPIHTAQLDKARPVLVLTRAALGPQIGYLLPAREAALTYAIHAAFDLD